jgi:hypothetical protein
MNLNRTSRNQNVGRALPDTTQVEMTMLTKVPQHQSPLPQAGEG